jgi:hypothetical protein
MYLTKEEERILDGEEGEGLQKAMEILVALGEINEADRLMPISSAQVSGVSYKTIGDAGLEFLSDMASTGARVRVLTTLNPMGVDPSIWRELGYREDFVNKQMRIVNAYKAMGILLSCTCTPYLIGNLPTRGEHIAWAESSAVVFANSVLGAKTNRESGVSALASALIGEAPCYGLHLDENRNPTITIEVDAELKNQSDYAALGYYVGKSFGGIPLFKGIKPGMEEMKALGAALAVGSISMFYVDGITYSGSALGDKINVGIEELRNSYESLTNTEDVDVVCVGCPHYSLKEIQEVLQAKPSRDIWIFTCRQNKVLFEKKLDENIKIIADTCMVVSPLEDLGISSIGVNSAKAAFYSANLSGLKVRFDSLENMLKL